MTPSEQRRSRSAPHRHPRRVGLRSAPGEALPRMVSRRAFMEGAMAAVLGGLGTGGLTGCAGLGKGGSTPRAEPFFLTRGAVLVVKDMQTYDWPVLAKEAGLTTLATHIAPSEIAGFVKTDAGQRFLEGCRLQGIAVEHELHALGDLLPRALFDQDPALFRMDERGERVRDHNLCVHSARALEVVAENATRYTRLLPSTTGRYFYWIDDAMPMCRCRECRGFSDSDQALLLENHVLGAIRQVDSRATLAHLAYANTIDPPKVVKAKPGIFLEFAPIQRRYDAPLSQRDVSGPGQRITHGRLLDALEANLEWFGRGGAQALEYWLDVSRFSGWKRDRTREIPWNDEVFRDDLRTYAERGIRHVTTFAAWLDVDYARRWGVEPARRYGAGLKGWLLRQGQPWEAPPEGT